MTTAPLGHESVHTPGKSANAVHHADGALRPWELLARYFGKRAYRKGLILTAGCVIVHKLLASASPFLLGWAMRAVQILVPVGAPAPSVEGSLVKAVFVIGVYVLVRFLSSVFGDGKDVLFVPIEQQVSTRLARDLFARVQGSVMAYHVQRKTGGLMRTVDLGTKAIESFSRFFLFNIVPAALEMLIACGFLLVLYPPFFALTLATTLAAYAAFTVVVAHKRLRTLHTMHHLDQASHTVSLEGLVNIQTVKLFAQEKTELGRYVRFLAKRGRLLSYLRVSLTWLNIGQVLILSVGLGLLLVRTAVMVMHHQLTVVDFVIMNSVVLQFIMPLHALGFAYREVRQAWLDITEMGRLFGLPQERADESKSLPLHIERAEIIFDRVNFGYTKDRLILNNCSFVIPAGAKVAFVGPSGAGKSTVFSLLMRFYDPQEGRLLISGQDLRTCTRTSIRQSVGLVAQDVLVFDDTLRYNLLYGAPHVVTEKQIADVIQAAQLEGLLARLPQGLDTRIGERGVTLSGGERQRLSIGRLMIRQPEILLLDEATSALDVATEKQVHHAIMTMAAHRTTCVIAHRLAAIVNMDQIFVMHAGSVVQQGTHKQLMAQHGLYSELWHHIESRRDKEN